MKRKILTYITCLAVFATLAGTSAFAGSGIVSIDRVDGLLGGDTVHAGQTLRIILRYNNTGTDGTGIKCDVANGWRISSYDGAVWDSILLDSIGGVNGSAENLFLVRFNQTGSIGNYIRGNGAPTADTVGFLGSGTPGSASRQLPTTWNDSSLQIFVYFHDATSHNKHICIDSSFFGTGGTWKWVGSNLVDYFPAWVGLGGTQVYNNANGGFCFLIWDAAQGVDGTDGANLPKTFALQQNYPNPFNPTTTVRFDVPSRSQVKLTVYNVLGQKVKTLVDGMVEAGFGHEARWDGTSDGGNAVSSGIYFYKIEAGSFVQTKKMVMMK